MSQSMSSACLTTYTLYSLSRLRNTAKREVTPQASTLTKEFEHTNSLIHLGADPLIPVSFLSVSFLYEPILVYPLQSCRQRLKQYITIKSKLIQTQFWPREGY